MTPWHHAMSSQQKFGGKVEDYLPIHNWFDASKAHYADFRHRALRHHSAGIFECEQHFGPVLVNSAGREVPVRVLGEQHVKEDCGFIPTVADWLSCIKPEPWMRQVAKKSRHLKMTVSAQPAEGLPSLAVDLENFRAPQRYQCDTRQMITKEDLERCRYLPPSPSESTDQ